MGQTYQIRQVHRAGVIALAIVASGCQTTGTTPAAYAGAAYPNPYPPYNYAYGAPAGTPPQQPVAAAPAAAGFDVEAYQELKTSNQTLKDRLDRVEKAMLRLDRRMQLVERNELSRMSEDQQSSITNGSQQMAMQSLGMTPASQPNDADQGDYHPVSSHGESLASVMVAPAGSPPPARGTSVSEGLPSLADVDEASGRSLEPGNSTLAIWTVRYGHDKVWPDRDQLPSSREVVESLRQPSGVTITARGRNSSSVQFRERVRALSRYLSKVSSLDSVPIAAMPAPQMDDDTIEIIATH